MGWIARIDLSAESPRARAEPIRQLGRGSQFTGEFQSQLAQRAAAAALGDVLAVLDLQQRFRLPDGIERCWTGP